MVDSLTCDVAIVGGGPSGMTLAIELGRRGIACLLLDDKPGTTDHPQANATQARTMEHYRRLGFAHEIRALGMPPDFTTDVAYFTRLSKLELARLRLPSSAQAAKVAREARGSWSTPELPHRCSQLFFEPVLRRHAESHASADVRFGWAMDGFTEDESGVTLEAHRVSDGRQIKVRAKYLAGCDGGRSAIRRQLGYAMEGESRIARDFMGGKVHATYFRSSRLYDLIRGDRAWMYFTFNRERRSFMVSMNGTDTFVFHAQLRPEESDEEITPERAQEMFEQALGMPCPVEPISASSWHAGHVLVAERYATKRVFLVGDAAHLFTPTGGLGYNTAIDDVANLGWKLAAVLKGWAPESLLATYESERRPIGVRNTRMSRGFADHIGYFLPDPHLEDESEAGERARATAAAFLQGHLESEFSIPGITFGVRYDGSPIVISDGTAVPPDEINKYVPTACPGGRAPHVWLPDGASLFDRFGREFTLLAMRPLTANETAACDAAGRAIPLTLLALANDELRATYAADFALIRPDHHVAWRGNSFEEALAALPRAAGHAAAASRPTTSGAQHA